MATRTKKEAKQYYNPPIEKGISSGDKKLDFVYNNQWLFDTPIVGTALRKKAEVVARGSTGASHLSDNLNEAKINKQLLKAGSMTEYVGQRNNDLPSVDLVSQYFSKNPTLPKSIYKPSSDYLEFLPSYSVKKHFNEKEADDVINWQVGEILSDGGNIQDIEKINNRYKEFLTNKKPVFANVSMSSLERAVNANLAHHKVGMGWDEDINLPYVSISDAWDFSPDNYTKNWGGKQVESGQYKGEFEDENKRQQAKIQAALMHKSGYPFKIYDRFYFDSDSKKYISDKEIAKIKAEKSKGVIKKLGVDNPAFDTAIRYYK